MDNKVCKRGCCASVYISTKHKRMPTQHIIIALACNSLSAHQHYHDMSFPGVIFDSIQCCRFQDILLILHNLPTPQQPAQTFALQFQILSPNLEFTVNWLPNMDRTV